MPDDDPRQESVFDRIDDQIATAAMIRPECDKGFAIKAWLTQQYGDGRPGEVLARSLLVDLMVRGNMTGL